MWFSMQLIPHLVDGLCIILKYFYFLISPIVVIITWGVIPVYVLIHKLYCESHPQKVIKQILIYSYPQLLLSGGPVGLQNVLLSFAVLLAKLFLEEPYALQWSMFLKPVSKLSSVHTCIPYYFHWIEHWCLNTEVSWWFCDDQVPPSNLTKAVVIKRKTIFSKNDNENDVNDVIKCHMSL